MEKREIIRRLSDSYKSFSDFVSSLSDDDFAFAPEGKWNAGQQLNHLIKAISPLSTGLRWPKFIVRLMFGKTNRPSKSYEDLVNKYRMKLEAGGKASGRFIPKLISPTAKVKNVKKLLQKVDQLNKNINRYSEKQLDAFILPHPLLGRVTLREMMYFTIYHAAHHLNLVKKYLATEKSVANSD